MPLTGAFFTCVIVKASSIFSFVGDWWLAVLMPGNRYAIPIADAYTRAPLWKAGELYGLLTTI